MKKRLDQLLVERQLAKSRSQGRQLILAGLVEVEGRVIDKAGFLVEEGAKITIKEKMPYVSRGGLKLEKAIEEFKLDFKDKIVADIGASTGGFTDCVLKKGARRVYAIDVGKGQLAWELRNNPQVVVMEKTNIRHLKGLPEKIDFFLLDLSFISLKKVLPHLKDWQDHGAIICLFKPQFEAGKKIASLFKGVIKDPQIHEALIKDFKNWLQKEGFVLLGMIQSPLLGDKGNKEFFFHLTF